MVFAFKQEVVIGMSRLPVAWIQSSLLLEAFEPKYGHIGVKIPCKWWIALLHRTVGVLIGVDPMSREVSS